MISLKTTWTLLEKEKEEKRVVITDVDQNEEATEDQSWGTI